MIERVIEEKTKSGANKKHYSTVHIKQKRLRRWDVPMHEK